MTLMHVPLVVDTDENDIRMCYFLDNMADENVSAPAPTRSDDQILPFAMWVPIGKSNYVMDLQKKQTNPIFQIAMDILQNTNFSSVHLRLQLLFLWDGNNMVHTDANLLMEALENNTSDQAPPFVSTVGDGKYGLREGDGYPEISSFFSVAFGIITSTNVDYAELMWEEFVQAMQTFLTIGNRGVPIEAARKDRTHPLVLYFFDYTNASYSMISNNIRNAPYYNVYMEMVAKHDQKVAAKKEGKKKTASAKEQGQEHVGGMAIREPVPEATRPLPIVEGKGKSIATDELAGQSLLALHTPKRRIVILIFLRYAKQVLYDRTSSGGDTEILQFGDEQGDDVTEEVNLEDKTAEIDERQAVRNPCRLAIAGQSLSHARGVMDMCTQKFIESLKFPADEHAFEDSPKLHPGISLNNEESGGALLFGDDQDPHPPPPDSDLSKKKQHDSGASGSSQPPAPQSSAWKMIDTREAIQAHP
ncbi:hypothetical protein Tco_0343250 [Tanacetum coccineum]